MTQMIEETSRAKIQNALGSMEHLPPTPEVLVALLKVIDDPDTTIDDIAEIVSADGSLTMTLLRLVNSASFGLARQLTTVKEAVQFVGANEIKNLSIAVAVKTGLIGHAPVCHSFDRKKLWRHFVASGLAANLIGNKLRHPDRKSAFAAGLLHDIGLVVIDAVFPHKMQFLVSEIESRDITMTEAELEIIGFTHGEVGFWVGEKWEMPKQLLGPMIHHEKPWEAVAGKELAALIHVADFIGAEESVYLRPQADLRLDARAMEILDIEHTFIDQLRSDLDDELDKMSSLLEM